MTDELQERDDLIAAQNEYNEAIQRNKIAKAHFESLLKQQRQNTRNHQTPHQNTHSSHSSTSRTRHQTHLVTHLQNLRLQRQYNSLHTLATYTKEIETIAEREHLYDDIAQRISSVGDNDGTQDEHEHEHERDDEVIKKQQQRVSSLISTAKELTSNLELALVSARLDLKREQVRLCEAAKGRGLGNVDDDSDGDGDGDRDGEWSIKLRALQATRAELQRWIAETLRRCEEEPQRLVEERNKTGLEDGRENDQAEDDSEEDRVGLGEDAIDAEELDLEYARYITARKRLLRVLDVLKRPLPSAPAPAAATASASVSSTNTNVKAQAEHNSTALGTTTQLARSTIISNNNQRPQLHHSNRSHQSPISLSYTSKTANFITGPPLSEIEALHIPTYQHAKMTSAYAADVKRQTHERDVRMLEMLTLLGHESHLLPAYPSHISGSMTRGFRVLVGDKEKSRRVNDGLMLTRESAEIERLLEAWASAAAAADEKLREQIDRDVDEAERVLGVAEEKLEDVRALEGMKREVIESMNEGRR